MLIHFQPSGNLYRSPAETTGLCAWQDTVAIATCYPEKPLPFSPYRNQESSILTLSKHVWDSTTDRQFYMYPKNKSHSTAKMLFNLVLSLSIFFFFFCKSVHALTIYFVNSSSAFKSLPLPSNSSFYCCQYYIFKT